MFAASMLCNRLRIVFDEHVDVDISGQPRDPWHDQDQHDEDGQKRIHDAHLQEEEGDDKDRYPKSYRKRIADVHRPKEEVGFDLIFKPAATAMLVHVHGLRDHERILVFVHALRVALRTSSC